MLGKRRKRDDAPGDGAPDASSASRAQIPPENLPYGSESKAELFADQRSSVGSTGDSALARVAREVVFQLADGVYVADASGVILDANPSLLTMLGVSDVASLGSRTFESFLSDLTDRRKGYLPDGVLRLTGFGTSPRTVRHYRVDVTSQTDVTSIGFVRELPGLFDKAMLENQRLTNLGTVAAKVIHDINNLLLAIMGNSDQVLEGGVLDEVQLVAVDQIVQACNRAAELTGELLSYASSGKSTGVVSEVALSQLVEETTRLLDIVIPDTVTLHYRLSRDLPTVRGDAMHLRRLVMNLVLNACEALEGAAGVVTVETRVATAAPTTWPSVPDSTNPVRGFVTLQVTDTGRGMDELTKRRIFEPFFTSKETGQGLGLASVAEILRLHNGSISVESAPGKGAKFSVYLPASPPGQP